MKINETNLKQIIEEETQAELQELYEQRLINEGVFSTFWNVLTGIPGGVVQNIKEWMAGKVLGWIGVNEGTPFHEIAVNFFGNLELADLAAIMSGDQKCVALTSELAGGFTEYIAEKVPEMLGLRSDGWLTGAVRESLGDELLKDLNQNIGEAVCELNFSKLFTGNRDSDISEIKKMLHEELSAYAQLKEEKEKEKKKKSDDKWIQKAVDPEHEGYCTPMTKKTCTPKRKAFAQTMKKLGKERKSSEVA